MLQTTTHYEHVPLEIVKKIIQEQIRQETATAQDQETSKRTLEDLFGPQAPSRLRSRTFSQEEVLKQP